MEPVVLEEIRCTSVNSRTRASTARNVLAKILNILSSACILALMALGAKERIRITSNNARIQPLVKQSRKRQAWYVYCSIA
jgi:hypothetical protein